MSSNFVSVTPKQNRATSSKKKNLRRSTTSLNGYADRRRRTPLKDVSNVSRSLQFSSPSPAKRISMHSDSIELALKVSSSKKAPHPSEESPVKEADASSRDSGFSESVKKYEDEECSRDSTVACNPRKLNLDVDISDSSDTMFMISPTKPASHSPASTCVETSKSVISRLPTIKISPDNLVSQNSNFPTSLARPESIDKDTKGLASLLTEHSVDEEDDFYMRELYTLDEREEDQDSVDGCAVPKPIKIDALLSATVQLKTRTSPSTTGSNIPCSVRPKPCASDSTTPVVSKRRGLRALASSMDVSPYNPQARAPIRRTLSWCDPTANVSIKVSILRYYYAFPSSGE